MALGRGDQRSHHHTHGQQPHPDTAVTTTLHGEHIIRFFSCPCVSMSKAIILTTFIMLLFKVPRCCLEIPSTTTDQRLVELYTYTYREVTPTTTGSTTVPSTPWATLRVVAVAKSPHHPDNCYPSRLHCSSCHHIIICPTSHSPSDPQIPQSQLYPGRLCVHYHYNTPRYEGWSLPMQREGGCSTVVKCSGWIV